MSHLRIIVAYRRFIGNLNYGGKMIIMPTKEFVQDLIPKKKIIECDNCGLIHLESERVDDVCPRCNKGG